MRPSQADHQIGSRAGTVPSTPSASTRQLADPTVGSAECKKSTFAAVLTVLASCVVEHDQQGLSWTFHSWIVPCDLAQPGTLQEPNEPQRLMKVGGKFSSRRWT